MTNIRNRAPSPRVGLVLGSGSSRGWAHIGAIEALQDNNIPIHLVTGTSAGAFVGAVFAGGGLQNLKEFALAMDWKRVLAYMDMVFPRSGFIDGRKVAEMYKLHCSAVNFSDLKLPFKVVATDLMTGEEIILDKGSIHEALRASMSVPGILTPVQYGNHWLIDGGVVNPLPVNIAKEMKADLIIAVDLNSEIISRHREKRESKKREKATEGVEKKRLEVMGRWIEQYGAGRTLKRKITKWFSRDEPSPHIFEVMGSSINIMQEKIAASNLIQYPPDILIQPRLGDLKFFDFDQAERAIAEGYYRTQEALPAIRSLLTERS